MGERGRSYCAGTPETRNPMAVHPVDRLRFGEVPRGEKMLSSGTDPESYITEHTFISEDENNDRHDWNQSLYTQFESMIAMMTQLSCSQTCVLELLVGAWAVLATIREDVMVVSDRWDQAPSA